MERNKSVARSALESLKGIGPNVFAISLAVYVLCLIPIAIGLLDSIGLVFAFLLIGFPVIFSGQMSILYAYSSKKMTSNIALFHGAFSYYGMQYRGVYAAIRLLIKVILAWIIVYFIGSAILMASYPGFAGAITSAGEYVLKGDNQGAYNFILGSEAISNGVKILLGAGTGVTLLFTFHNFLVYGMNPYVRTMIGRDGGPGNVIYRDFLRRNRWKFYAETYKAFWMIPTLGMLGFAIGYTLGCLYLSQVSFALSAGVAASLLLVIPFFPYYAMGNSFLLEEFEPQFYASVYFSILDMSNKLKATGQITPAEQASIDEALEKLKQRAEKGKEEDESSSSESNDSDTTEK